MKHVWQVLGDESDHAGEVDLGAYDVEAEGVGHNGPRCTVCGFFFCMICERGKGLWESDCPGRPMTATELVGYTLGVARQRCLTKTDQLSNPADQDSLSAPRRPGEEARSSRHVR
jgi:hypothetical protein